MRMSSGVGLSREKVSKERSQLVEAYHVMCGCCMEGRKGHDIRNGGGWILNNGQTSSLPSEPESRATILVGAGQDQGHQAWAPGSGGSFEEDIDGRTGIADPFLCREGQGEVLFYEQVVVGWGDVDVTSKGHGFFFGLLDLEMAVAVQMPDEKIVREGALVLDNQDRGRERGWKGLEDNSERIESPGGCSDNQGFAVGCNVNFSCHSRGIRGLTRFR